MVAEPAGAYKPKAPWGRTNGEACAAASSGKAMAWVLRVPFKDVETTGAQDEASPPGKRVTQIGGAEDQADRSTNGCNGWLFGYLGRARFHGAILPMGWRSGQSQSGIFRGMTESTATICID